MIISRTPFRVSFFGGGTDYPAWYREHGGAVLATTIDKYCYLSLRHLPPFFQHKSRLAYSKIELVQSSADFEHPSARECLRFMGISSGVEIHHDADLPARTGLGSSSSFTVGLLHALYALREKMPSKIQLAKEAIHIEREKIGESVGNQDQVCAAFGGLNRITFHSDHEMTIEPIIAPKHRLSRLNEHMMLYFTGQSRFASDIAVEQIKSTARKQTELRRMFEMVDEGLDILVDGDLTDFGELLHESWQLKRSLTDRVSTPLVDEVYAAAREAGAIGGKLLGAGGGGFLLLFAPPERQEAIRTRLDKLLYVPFEFESSGSQIIFYDTHSYRPAASPARAAE